MNNTNTYFMNNTNTYFKYVQFFLLFAIFLLSSSVTGQNCGTSNNVGGRVYLDADFNGLNDEYRGAGVEGVKVEAYDYLGNLLGTSVTDVKGQWAIGVPDSTIVRLQFSDFPEDYYDGVVGPMSRTSIQFRKSPDCNCNLGLSTTGTEMCDFLAPFMTDQYTNGKRTGNAGVRRSMPLIQYLQRGFSSDYSTYPPKEDTAKFAKFLSDVRTTGATWGNTWDRRSKTFFASAVVKRFSDFGPGGIGAIYKVDDPEGAGTISEFIDLSQCLGITDLPRPGIAEASEKPSFDKEGYEAAGKEGIGGLSISRDGLYLYAVSLSTKELVQVKLRNASPDPLFSSVSCSDITTYPIPPIPSCNGTDNRPWAVKCRKGKVYVGEVCSAESTGVPSDMTMQIFEFDPNTGAWNGLFDSPQPLDYPTKGCITGEPKVMPPPEKLKAEDFNYICCEWLPWLGPNDYTFEGPNAGYICHPQPLLSAIEFDRDGSVILGLMDRFGLQGGWENWHAYGDKEHLYDSSPGGDILYAYNDKKAGKYIVAYEKDVKDAAGATIKSGCGYGTGADSGDEFYCGDNTATNYAESFLGGFIFDAGLDDMVGGFTDAGFSLGAQNTAGAGIQYLDNGTGVARDFYSLYHNANCSSFGKAMGVGDLERLCDPPPMEIGNKVWLDYNQNGIHDPGEMFIRGVIMNLYDLGGTLLATDTTDAYGEYKFSSVDYPTKLIEGGTYIVSVENYDPGVGISGTTIIATTPDSGTNDLIDSDGKTDGASGIAAIGGKPYTIAHLGSLGQNDHSYDFGFYDTSCRLIVNSEVLGCNSTQNPLTVEVEVLVHYLNMTIGDQVEVKLGNSIKTFTVSEPKGIKTLTMDAPVNQASVALTVANTTSGVCSDSSTVNTLYSDISATVEVGECYFDWINLQSNVGLIVKYNWQNLTVGDVLKVSLPDGREQLVNILQESGNGTVAFDVPADGSSGEVKLEVVSISPCSFIKVPYTVPGECLQCMAYVTDIHVGECSYDGTTSTSELSVDVYWYNKTLGQTITVSVPTAVGTTSKTITADKESDTRTVTFVIPSNGSTGNVIDVDFGNCVAKDTTYAALKPCEQRRDLALDKTADVNTANIGDVVTWTINVTHQGDNFNATGVVVKDLIPAGLTYNGTGNATKGSFDGTNWTIGTMSLGDIETLTFQTTVDQPGVYINKAEISVMNEGDSDSTPGNGRETEDDYDQDCVSVPYDFCEGDEYEVAAQHGLYNYQWYKDGAEIAGATSRVYTVTSPGEYSFEATRTADPTKGEIYNCCPMKFESANCNCTVSMLTDMVACVEDQNQNTTNLDVCFDWDKQPVNEVFTVNVSGNKTSPLTQTYTVGSNSGRACLNFDVEINDEISVEVVGTTCQDSKTGLKTPKYCDPVCDITLNTPTVGSCNFDVATNKSTVTVDAGFAWNSLTPGKDTIVFISNGGMEEYPVTTEDGTDNISLVTSADGLENNLYMYIKSNTNCMETRPYQSPPPCDQLDCKLEIDTIMYGACINNEIKITFRTNWVNAKAGDFVTVTVNGETKTTSTFSEALAKSGAASFSFTVPAPSAGTVTASIDGGCSDTKPYSYLEGCENCYLKINNFEVIEECFYNEEEKKSQAKVKVCVEWGNAYIGDNIAIQLGDDSKSGAFKSFSVSTEVTGERCVELTLDADGTQDMDLKANFLTGLCEDFRPDYFDVSESCAIDLALKKRVEKTYVKYGEDVPFTITVFNQGYEAPKEVSITDYMPEGFEFDPTKNTGWSVVSPGKLEYVLKDVELNPGDSSNISVVLTPKLGAQSGHKFINEAEISEIRDTADNVRIDLDSWPDDDPDNDNNVVPESDDDDEIEGTVKQDSDDDEDDNDVAEVKLIDLALKKELPATAPFRYGEFITFNITVYNQGDVPVKDVEVTDYVPEGFTFDAIRNPLWNGADSDKPVYTIGNTIMPGDSVIFNISLLCNYIGEPNPEAWVNVAEISRIHNVDGEDVSQFDYDSTPDDNPDNDAGGKPDSPSDDSIDGTGTGFPGSEDPNTDEDDADPVRVKVYDLALRKKLVAPEFYTYYDLLTFEITVFNQGTDPVRDVIVYDSVPHGLQYKQSDNPGWTGSAPIVSATMPGIIEVGDSAKVQIKLVMLPYDGDLQQWDNYAEIVSSKDTSGQITITWDADSYPNSNSPHEVAVRPDDPDDNNIDGHYMPDGTDEDDHDPADVGIFDLALKKTLSALPTSLEYGQVVDFDITVYNQGSFVAKNIKVVDYIPDGYYFAKHLNADWDYSPLTGIASTIITEPLLAQDSVTVTLALQFRYTPEKGGYLNVAEIAYAEDDGGNARDDFDSVADENPDNDGGGKVNTPTDNSIDGDGTGRPGDEDPNTDEDDADPWGIEVASIGNYVWFDKNDNGLQDDGLPSEVGVEGVTVALYTEGGRRLLTQKTDSLGHYLFENLIPGKYSLKFEDLPAGSAWTSSNEGNDDGLDSDPNTDGLTAQTELSPGETDLSWDAGIVVLSSIGDYVWLDDNEDGIQDAWERPVWGVEVNLLDKDGNVLKTTTTDAYGRYLFTGLRRGTYIVEFVKDENIAFTVANTPGDDAKDSDADVNTGRSGVIELEDNQHIRTIDAGLICTMDVELIDPGASCSSSSVVIKSQFLSEGAKPVTYQWSTGEQTPDIKVPANGTKTYSLTVTDKFGCRDIEDVTISVAPKTKIGDYVWYDRNHDGLQQDNQFDPSKNEFGIDSVIVKLYEVVGGVPTFLRDTLTATVLGEKGYYSFDVCAGDYLLEFVPPTGKGYSFTRQNIGNDDSDDSDADPNTGRTHTFTVSSGHDDVTLDAGFFRTASLGDYVWHDSNADGIQDEGEEGVDSVMVVLKRADGTKLDSMYTHDGGKYEFTNLVPDWYFVCFDYSKTKYSKISPQNSGNDDSKDSDAGENGCTELTQITAGENDLSWDMGLYSLSSLGDRVWLDKNANGCQDADEEGIEGVEVKLYYDRDLNGVPDPGAVILATQKTDSLGYYKFEGLEADNYLVQFVKPTTPKYYSSPKNNNDSSTGGCGDEKDSDGNKLFGYSDGVSLGDYQHNPTIDQGYYEKASVGDRVWLDNDSNGIQDDGETGVSKVTVTLYKDTDGDGVPEKAIETMVTDENGNYLFDELDPGTYHICFDLNGSSYSAFTKAHSSGSSSENDSNADKDSGCTEVFVLNSGDEDLTQDAGVIETCSLGDYVWFDENADGIQNSMERGISGVVVTLYNESGKEVKKGITDSQGKYLFTGLNPGKYKVHFGNPDESSYVLSPRYAYNKGDDSNADIDGFSEEVTLVGGQHDPTIDAGFYKGACLEGEYWLEEVGNKLHDVQDNSDKEVDGVKISLYSDKDENDPSDDVLFDIVTVKEGEFYFSNVPAGNYYYTAELPADTRLVETKSDRGSNATDSDFYTTESGVHRSHRFNVQPGGDTKTCKKDIDLGVTKQEKLPVEIIEFSADWNAEQEVVALVWSTMNEDNLSYFELYRRAEDEEGFAKLADVDAVGGSSMESYGMLDPNVQFGLRYYYRLVPVDFDGQRKAKYEASVLVPGYDFKVNAYPNPVTDNLYVVVSGESLGDFTVELLDNLGRKVMNKIKVKSSNKTYEKVRLDTRDLPQGTYYIRVVKGSRLELYKIVHTR